MIFIAEYDLLVVVDDDDGTTPTMEQIDALIQINKEQQNLDEQLDNKVELNKKLSSIKIADLMQVDK